MSSFDEIVAEVYEAYKAKDFAAVIKIISTDNLVVWFGVDPNVTRQILTDVIEAGADKDGVVTAFYNFVVATGKPTARNYGETAWQLEGVSQQSLALLHRMFMFRFKGHHREALATEAKLTRREQEIPIFNDPSHGWQNFITVQCGITAMLAGDLLEALHQFQIAQAYKPTPALSFLNRDAFAKSALVLAGYGDWKLATAHIAKAKAIARTSSWAEPGIDACIELAEILLLYSDYELSLKKLHEIKLQDLGELWPYYVLAVHRVYERLGDTAGFLAELVSLAKIPFIAVEGNGLAGSIFALTKASSMIISGNLAEAKTLLQTVDQEFVGTKIVRLFAELSQGRAASVVEKAHLLRKETKGLQQLEMMRLSLLAQALLMTDAKTEAIELLSMSNSSAVALSRVELSYFSPTVNDFAAKNITGWPDTDQRIEAQFIADLMQKKPVFSQREIEVLGLLADGKTREEIAQTLFISINTVKKHLQKIYQSLGVASRNAAVLEAQKRGLI